MPKELEFLIIHCTATPEGRPVSRQDIERWHIEGRGWSRVGYSDMIHLDGSLENLIPWNTDNVVDPWEISNGVKGHNTNARHVVYVGGMSKRDGGIRRPKDTRTREQLLSLMIYIRYIVLRHPKIKVGGHNQFANKACPSFDTVAWLKGFLHDDNILM